MVEKQGTILYETNVSGHFHLINENFHKGLVIGLLL